MEEDGLQWTGFRDLASPGEAALAFIELYGTDAVRAARDCVTTAAADSRDDDRRFWLEVVEKLNALQRTTGTGPPQQS